MDLVGICTWQPVLWNLGKPFSWEPSLGNLYLGTIWTSSEPLLGNLNSRSLATFTWNLYSGTLWEPVPCHFDNFGNLVETLLRNLVGTFAMETWLPWQPWKPSLENFYSGTVWEPSLGKLGIFTWKFWGFVLGNLGSFTWEPFGPFRNLYLGTLGTFTWEPLLGIVVGTCTV